MEHRHTIGIVARRTGLSTHVIRMWERRYGVVEPARTDTNRRLYTNEDIERLTLLRHAVMLGEHIGHIAELSDADLSELVRTDRIAQDGVLGGTIAGEAADSHLALCLEAVAKFDAPLFESRLLQASMALGQRVLLESLLHPLLEKIGEMWGDGRLKVAHEHLASAVVRSLLGSMLGATRVDASAPKMIATTPSGQFHEFGALMAAITAVSSGWQVTYPGPNMPAEDIAASVLQSGARVLALSIVYPPDDPLLHNELKKLVQLIGDRAAIFIGGRSAAAYVTTANDSGIAVIHSLDDLRGRLDAVRSTAAPRNLH